MTVANVKSQWVGGDLYFYDKSGNEILHFDGTNRKLIVPNGSNLQNAAGGVVNQRFRVTAAQVNAGYTLVPALAGHKYRLIDATIIAIGGAAAGATTVDLLGTQTTGVKLLAIAVAALTQSAVVKPDTANVTVLADGASFVANDANTAITVGKTGSNLTTATHVDISLTYAVEEA